MPGHGRDRGDRRDQGSPPGRRGRRADELRRRGPGHRGASRPGRAASCSRTPRPTTWRPRSAPRSAARSTSTRRSPGSSRAGCAIGPEPAAAARTGDRCRDRAARGRAPGRASLATLTGAGAGGARRGRPRALEPGHRRRARHHRADGPDPRLEHPGQAGADEPDPGGALRRPARARRRTHADGPRDVRRRRTGRRPGHRVRPRHAADAGRPGRPQIADLAGEFRTIAARPARARRRAPTSRSPSTGAADARRARHRRRRPAAGRSSSACRSAATWRWTLAARSPERVRGLVLAGATRRADRRPRRVPYLGAGRGHGPRSTDRAWTALNALVLPDALPAGRSPSRSSPAGSGRTGGADALRALAGQRFVPRLAAYPGPTLILNGEYDLPFRLSAPAVRRAAAARRGASGSPARSHLSNLDRPAAFDRGDPPLRRGRSTDAAPGRSPAGSAEGPRYTAADPPKPARLEVRCAFARLSSPPPAGAPASCRPPRRSPRRCCRWSTSRSSSTRSRRPSPPGSSRSSSSPPARSGRSRTTSTSPTSSSTCSRRRATSRCSARSAQISDLAQVAYVRQKEQLGLGHAVLMAKDLIGHEPFAVILPDDVVVGDRPCIGQLIHAYHQTHGSVVAVMEVPPEETSRYGVIGSEPSEDPLDHGRLHRVTEPRREAGRRGRALEPGDHRPLRPDAQDLRQARADPARRRRRDPADRRDRRR